MNIQQGWAFMSADFSVQSSGKSGATGEVWLIRSPQDRARWHTLAEDEQDNIDLYVVGNGLTLEDAIQDANSRAAEARHFDDLRQPENQP